MLIKLLAMDVDGTLTDGKLHISEDGEIFKTFNVKDGLGIMLLHEHGIIPAIITGRVSKIVERRALELQISEVYQGIKDKSEVLYSLAKKHNINMMQIAYIGDDLNDLEAIKIAGLTFAPSDSCKTILDIVDFKLRSSGGLGAVREAIDYIISRNNK